jgi:hypothetical protein
MRASDTAEGPSMSSLFKKASAMLRVACPVFAVVR